MQKSSGYDKKILSWYIEIDGNRSCDSMLITSYILQLIATYFLKNML